MICATLQTGVRFLSCVLIEQFSVRVMIVMCSQEKTHRFAESRNLAEHADIPVRVRLLPHISPLSVYQIPLFSLSFSATAGQKTNSHSHKFSKTQKLSINTRIFLNMWVNIDSFRL